MTAPAELMPFEFDGAPVRVLQVHGDPWFVNVDVCRCLDIANPRSSVALLDEDERDVHTMDTPSGQQRIGIISEAGLYSLILRSRKPEAKAFKRWVTHEVLPTLRRTGPYSVPAQRALPQTYAEALRELASTVEAKELAEQRARELEPAAKSWTDLAEAGGDYSVREAAQILDRDQSISTGQKRLFAYLREIGWLDRNNEPYQAQVDAGRLALRVTGGWDHEGEHHATSQARITTKGLHELHKRMGGSGPLLLAA